MKVNNQTVRIIIIGSILISTALSAKGKLHKPIIAPKEVAMPFPPLKLRYIE
jgi:hypothetical protein